MRRGARAGAILALLGLAAPRSPRAAPLALDGSLAAFSSDLPVLVVDTGGARPSRERAAAATVALWMPGENGRAALSAPPDLVARAEVRLRGASSLRYPKKQLVLRFTGPDGADEPRPFLGMPPGATFVLRTAYVDKTLLRDALASALARDMGMPAPRARHAEVFLASHGDRPSLADHHGVYVAMENVEVGPGRVEIEPLGPADLAAPAITGGYLLRRDRPGPRETVVRTRRGEALVLQDPPPGRAQPQQVEWITGWLDRLEELLFSADARDRRAALALVDVGSFVDLGLLLEVTKNADALKTSTFFAKPRGGPLRAGPPWDFDVAMRNDPIAVDPTGWQALRLREGRSPWWPRLAEDPDVAQALADRFAVLRRGPLSDAAVALRIRALAAGVAEAARRNFRRWPVLGRPVGPNPDAPATWEEEVASLEAWLLVRLGWLEAQWLSPPRVVAGADGAIVLAEEGEVFAAPSDPRAPGGAIAGGATRLDGAPPARTAILSARGRPARCGAEERRVLRLPAGTDEIAIETSAPATAAFSLSLDGAPVASRPSFPIVRPLPELGSAVRADGLHLAFRAAAPAGSTAELAIRAGPRAYAPVHGAAAPGGARAEVGCALPSVVVTAVRLGRYALPDGTWSVRLHRGDRWSAPTPGSASPAGSPPRTKRGGSASPRGSELRRR